MQKYKIMDSQITEDERGNERLRTDKIEKSKTIVEMKIKLKGAQ